MTGALLPGRADTRHLTRSADQEIDLSALLEELGLGQDTDDTTLEESDGTFKPSLLAALGSEEDMTAEEVQQKRLSAKPTPNDLDNDRF